MAAPAANAAESWDKTLSCLVNYNCRITSTTTNETRYYVDGVQKSVWFYGGSYQWTGAISAGSHTARVWTSGTISAHTASCYCPGGVSCGS
nr:hypothetical protein GCM10025699_37580 [Microbacterium flavescens]